MSTDNLLLDALTARGVLVSVSVRYWRARKKLTADDLGLTDEQVDDSLISLGHKRLLPRDALHDLSLVEGRAHAFVDENSFPFLGGIAHYVPNEKLEHVRAHLRTLQQDFDRAQDTFYRQYAQLREDALYHWRRAAENLVDDTDRVLARIEAAFPPVDALDRYFDFNVSLFQVTTPEIPQAELIAAGTRDELVQARQQAAAEARDEIKNSCRDFIGDCVATLRQETATLCEQMLATINGNGNYVHQKTLNRLTRFIDRFKELNFANDTEMNQQLERVRTEFLSRSAEEYRNSDHARSRLLDGLANLRQTATQLAAEDAGKLVDQFGQLGTRKFDLVA